MLKTHIAILALATCTAAYPSTRSILIQKSHKEKSVSLKDKAYRVYRSSIEFVSDNRRWIIPTACLTAVVLIGRTLPERMQQNLKFEGVRTLIQVIAGQIFINTNFRDSREN